MPIPSVTLQQFRATARATADLGAHVDDVAVDGVPGMVYGAFDGVFLYVEKDGDGWMLTLERDTFSEPLADLEVRLYDYAIASGYVVRG